MANAKAEWVRSVEPPCVASGTGDRARTRRPVRGCAQRRPAARARPPATRARRIAWIPARGHKALSHRSHDTKRQRGSTCEKRKTTEPRVLRDDARKHRVHRRRGARGGARESGSSGARRRGRLRRRVLRVSFREIAAKSKTHLHDIASSDAGRAQGFPRVAREEVGELSLLLLLATRGLVALARLEVRARAQRGDPPQLRGQPGVELGSGRKAGGRVSVALRDAEGDRPIDLRAANTAIIAGA